MNRPRVLCVSSDRSTRAAVTLSLSDVRANVTVAETSSTAVDRLEREAFDAVVVDASTVANVPGLVDAVETRRPGTSAFVHWADDGDSSVAALTEVIARAGDDGSSPRLAEAITDRIAAAQSDPLAELVATTKRRLADATSPGSIERAIRESFTGYDGVAFAWLGEYDRGERQVVPWLTDSATVEWPMQRTFAIGDGSQPVLERAMRSRDLQVVGRVADNRDVVPLGTAAVERGVESIAVAPLGTDEELYGVLVVYGTDRLDADEREAIETIAETASYALESVAIRGKLSQQERVLRRYERLVETAGDGMYVLDADGHFTTVNDALVSMTGYSREGILGEHVSMVFADEGVEAGQRTIESLLSADRDGDDRSTDTIETELRTKGGRTIPCEIQLALLDHDEEFRGSVGVVRDVTERRRRVRTLREQNERLDAFARIVSHDLRNPLGVSQGYLDLLVDTGSMEYAEHVREGLDRMETIIADVLAVAREGQMIVETETVDLAEIADEAWATVSTEDATLSIDGTFSFEADRSRSLRLFENLFRNSVEHGGADVTVRVGPIAGEGGGDASGRSGPDADVSAPSGADADREGSIGFYVEDDGTGIPEEIREHVFESDVTSSSEGLGIGLWVVREVAEGHGWTTVATESVDGGARFEFAVDEP